MKISQSLIDGKSVLKIEGDLMIDSVAAAKPTILAAVAASTDIEFDLGGLGECDSAGIQLLLMARKYASTVGGRVWAKALPDSFRATLDRIGLPASLLDPPDKRR